MIAEELTKLGKNPSYLALGLDDLTRKAELDRFEKGDSDELIMVNQKRHFLFDYVYDRKSVV